MTKSTYGGFDIGEIEINGAVTAAPSEAAKPSDCCGPSSGTASSCCDQSGVEQAIVSLNQNNRYLMQEVEKLKVDIEDAIERYHLEKRP